MTNVPQPSFSPKGFVAPTESAVLAGVIADIQEAFGGNLNLSVDDTNTLATPQGQFATSMAAIISNCYNLLCNVTQQVDPAYAQGRMQDAIARIYFLERNPALSTVVQCVCNGLVGVVIPQGALAVAEDGNLYSCISGGTIPVSGLITLAFACVKTGPIACPPNTVNQIYRAIQGWDTINNPTEGVLGNNVETRAAFEARRGASIATNSLGSLPSIEGAVLSIAGVLDAYTTENTTGGTVTVGDFVLAPHSIYVAAVGGTDLEVATAIWSKKAPGAAYNGNTSVTVFDSSSGYNPPYPAYSVQFERPSDLPVLFDVNIVNGPTVPADYVTQIQSAIVNAFAGEDGGPRARIGSTIRATRFVAPVTALGSWVLIDSLQVGSPNNFDTASFTASIAGNIMTVSALTAGTLTVGDFVFGTGVLEGTNITALGSGSGSVGTYTITPNQTMSSSLLEAAKANEDTVVVGIDQVPTITPLDIVVSAL